MDARPAAARRRAGGGRHGQPALRLRGAGRRGGRPRGDRAAGRARPAVPRAHQRRVRPGDRPRDDPHAGLGARRHDHARLRLRRLRRGGGDGAARADRAAGDGAARRRRARDRLARRRRLDDRPDDAGLRGAARRRSSSRRWRDRAGLRHLRLPAQRLRDRGDEGARRRGRRHRRGGGQQLRGHRRGGAPGPPADPPAPARQPGARVVVTGCAAQTEPAAFAAMPEVDLVLGNAEKLTPRRLGAAGRGPSAGAARSRSATSWPSAGRRRR